MHFLKTKKSQPEMITTFKNYQGNYTFIPFTTRSRRFVF